MGAKIDIDSIVGFTDILDTVYYAGFFDGEGTVHLRQNKAPNGKVYPVLHVNIGQSDRRVLDYLQAIWGGNIYVYKPAEHRKMTKEFFQWSIVGTRAHKFILQVRPYLKVRDLVADEALRAYQDHLARMEDNVRERERIRDLPPEAIPGCI